MNIRKLILLSVLVVMSRSVFAQEAKVEEKSEAKIQTEAKEEVKSNDVVTCELKGETRKLEILADGEGCKLEYTKTGATTTIATQKKGHEKCKEVSDKTKGKLEASGYTCK